MNDAHICPWCNEGRLKFVRGYEPWSTDHHACEICDSTYNEKPEGDKQMNDTPTLMTHERILSGEEYVSYSDYISLERERDEARNNAYNYKEGFHIQSLRAEQAERERDKWREYAERLIAEEFERLKEAIK